MTEKKHVPLIDKITNRHLNSVESIEDLPDAAQLKVIKSVLNAPVIPISFKKIHEVMGNQIKIKKEGKDSSFEDLSETEKEGEHPLTPQFFINVVLSNPRYLDPLITQININNMFSKAYLAFVVSPDDPIFDEFRATCQLKYEDVQKIRKLKEKQEKQKIQEAQEESEIGEV